MQSERVTNRAPASAFRLARHTRSYYLDLVFGRTLPALFFSVFIVYKLILLWESFAPIAHHGADATRLIYALNQALGLAYFTLLAVMYGSRLPKRGGLKRVETTLAAFWGTFSILLASFLPVVPVRAQIASIADIMIAGGLAYTIWGLAYLRRSFSIMPEARRLVTGGPYALSRHPLYFGEAVAAVGIVLPNGGAWAVVLILFYLVAQYLRIRWEEQVLLEQFPNSYAKYRRCVPKYLPRPWRLFR
jgi:protein-S-isoprenylcysteine O-methyltransferase Ste14